MCRLAGLIKHLLHGFPFPRRLLVTVLILACLFTSILAFPSREMVRLRAVSFIYGYIQSSKPRCGKFSRIIEPKMALLN